MSGCRDVGAGSYESTQKQRSRPPPGDARDPRGRHSPSTGPHRDRPVAHASGHEPLPLGKCHPHTATSGDSRRSGCAIACIMITGLVGSHFGAWRAPQDDSTHRERNGYTICRGVTQFKCARGKGSQPVFLHYPPLPRQSEPHDCPCAARSGQNTSPPLPRRT